MRAQHLRFLLDGVIQLNPPRKAGLDRRVVGPEISQKDGWALQVLPFGTNDAANLAGYLEGKIGERVK
jgi:hypothetical protein